MQVVNADHVNMILDTAIRLDASRNHDGNDAVQVPIKVDSYYKISDAEISLACQSDKKPIYLAWTNRAALGFRSDATKDEWLPGIFNGMVSLSSSFNNNLIATMRSNRVSTKKMKEL